MLGLIVDALRARPVQACVMALLAGVTVSAAVTADRAGGAVERTATEARIKAATPQQRTLSVRGSVVLGDNPAAAMDRFRNLAGATDTGRAERSITGARLAGVLHNGDRRQSAELRTLDDVCANVIMTAGRCATADGEVMIGADMAKALEVEPGGTLRHEATLTSKPVQLTVVGFYQPMDPVGWYWAGQAGTAVFTTLATIGRAGSSVVASSDTLLRPAAFDDAEALDTAIRRLGSQSVQVSSGAPTLAAEVATDRRATLRGVRIIELQVLLFGALAVAVAAAYAAQERRADAARMAIRGLPRRRMLAATAGQSLLPLVVGGLVPFAVAWALTGGAALRQWPLL
ncbi:hypothetical protein, partial [Dactylosporangium fulvum]